MPRARCGALGVAVAVLPQSRYRPAGAPPRFGAGAPRLQAQATPRSEAARRMARKSQEDASTLEGGRSVAQAAEAPISASGDDPAEYPRRTRPDRALAIGFMYDTLRNSTCHAGGRVHSRMPDAAPGAQFRRYVAAFRSQTGFRRGEPPEVVQSDLGRDFTAITLDHWAYCRQVPPDFS